MNVVFNADDFGLSKGVNLGIMEAYRHGPVRSATIMANMPGFEHAAELAQANPGLGIGVHLTLTAGKSVGGVYQTLTDEKGAFWRLTELEEKIKSNQIDLSEVEREYEAQIQKVLSAGLKPDHFDGHHHTQTLAGIVTIFLRLAKKYGVKVRLYDTSLLTGEYAKVRACGAFSDTFYKEKATVDELKRTLCACQADSLEIMCHPAYVDQVLYAASSYNIDRAFELDVLTNQELSAFMAERGFMPCSFAAI